MIPDYHNTIINTTYCVTHFVSEVKMPPKRQRIMIKRDILSTSGYYDPISKKVFKLYNRSLEGVTLGQQNTKTEHVPYLIGVTHDVPKYAFAEHGTITIKFNGHDIYCTTTVLSDYMSDSTVITRLYQLRLESETEEIINNFITSSVCTKKRSTPALYECNLHIERWEKRKDIEETYWDTYVMAQAKQNKITKRIDDFLHSKNDYVKHNKNYKLVFLLIGPPGTGKSTLCKLIAQYANRDMFALPMDQTVTDNVFSKMYNKVKNESVIVLEDLDRIYSKQSGNKTMISLSTILNAFDGPQTLQGNIVIITANDTAHFEEALTRSGRIDEVVVFSHICEEECYQAFKIFNCNNFTANDKKRIVDLCTVNNVTTCELTEFLFNNRKDFSNDHQTNDPQTHDWGKLFQEYIQNIRKRSRAKKNTPHHLYT